MEKKSLDAILIIDFGRTLFLHNNVNIPTCKTKHLILYTLCRCHHWQYPELAPPKEKDLNSHFLGHKMDRSKLACCLTTVIYKLQVLSYHRECCELLPFVFDCWSRVMCI